MGLCIIAALLINGALLAWMLYDRNQGLEQEAGSASAAEYISEAARQVSDTAGKARAEGEEAAAKDQAARHVYAHRGSSGASLEHSFTAYDEAIADGAVMIEQDIVISADGILFLSHDTNAYRMTGDSRAYADMTGAEIDQLRTHAGEKVLRLSEVFDRYGDSVTYVVELKSSDQRTVDAFTALVQQYGNQDRIIAQCFDMEALRILEETFPDMPKIFLSKFQDPIDQALDEPYIDIISVEDYLMTEDNIRKVHDSGKMFSAWTLNGEDTIRRAIDMGVDTYFTDDVKTAVSLEEEYGYEKRSGQ